MGNVYKKSMLITLLFAAITLLNACATKPSSMALESKIVTPNIATLPRNNGGVRLKTPFIVENGSIVPVTVFVAEPVMPNDLLIITGDGEKAIVLKEDLIKPIKFYELSSRSILGATCG